jgi:hypothetical protein
MSLPADIRDLEDQLDKVYQDGGALVAGLTEERGAWRRPRILEPGGMPRPSGDGQPRLRAGDARAGRTRAS